MAGIIKVDRVQSDSNLAFNIGGSNVAYFNTDGINMTGNQIITGNGILRTTTGMLYANNGIAFPGTQNASADPNVLDDYEEGSWTPTVNGDSGSATYTSNGRYTKIGNVIHVAFFVQLTSKGTLSGEIRVGNLPFTCENAYTSASAEPWAVNCSWFGGMTTSVIFIGGWVNNASTFMQFRPQTSASTSLGAAYLNATNIANDYYYQGCATYRLD